MVKNRVMSAALLLASIASVSYASERENPVARLYELSVAEHNQRMRKLNGEDILREIERSERSLGAIDRVEDSYCYQLGKTVKTLWILEDKGLANTVKCIKAYLIKREKTPAAMNFLVALEGIQGEIEEGAHIGDDVTDQRSSDFKTWLGTLAKK